MKRAALIAAATLLVAAAALWLALAPAPPHVVVLIGCTVRRDQVSPYGGPPSTTPFLQHAADHGTVFEDLVATAPWTRPASTGLLTGRFPTSLGMVGSAEGVNRAIPDHVHTLAEHFHDAGYRTFGATANPNLDATFGFAQGFDHYQENLDSTWRRGRLSGIEVADQLLASIDADRQRGPVFVQAMLIDAHAPRRPTRPELRAQHTDIPALAAYRATLRHLDDALVHFTEGLAARGIDPSNTLFVFVTDHGEGLSLPPNQGRGHGTQLAPSVVRVPWIVWGPGIPELRRIDTLASGIDVLPTVVSLAGLEPHPTVEGLDLSPLLDDPYAAPPRDRAFVDTWFRDVKRAAVFGPAYACQQDFGTPRDDRHFEAGCFDRRTDPWHQHPRRAPQLFEELTAWRVEMEQALGATDAPVVDPDADMTEHLEKLGYIE